MHREVQPSRRYRSPTLPATLLSPLLLARDLALALCLLCRPELSLGRATRFAISARRAPRIGGSIIGGIRPIDREPIHIGNRGGNNIC